MIKLLLYLRVQFLEKKIFGYNSKSKEFNFMKALISYVTCLFFFINISAQEIPIQEYDWDALQETKPWEATERWNPVPKKVTPGHINSMPPSDAIVLFDGSDLSAWHKPKYCWGAGYQDTKGHIQNNVNQNFPGTKAEWHIKSGAIEVVPGGGNLATKEKFGSAQLHIEWLAPVDPGKEGQLYSNSGVFFMGLYEIQVLNSFENETYPNGQAGSVYKQYIPLVNANKPPGEWQSYDIIFNAPKFNSQGKVTQKATFTVFMNGIVVQNNVEVKGPTFYIGEGKYIQHPEKMPLVLQDHGDKVRFRNIWIREL